ncbi:MAG: hypothetical protein IJH34_01230 [Romboutsia sp.]|nr:hypothetical protein [Romboutsia sp.]
MKILDTVILGIDLVLFMYFYNIAINTTDMTTRLISCAAMTFEVYFIRKHLKIMKRLKSSENKNDNIRK